MVTSLYCATCRALCTLASMVECADGAFRCVKCAKAVE